MNLNIELAGVSVSDEIALCLNTLLSTRVGEVALDRKFGIDDEPLSMPTEQAKALISVEILNKIRKYEPRVNIKEIICSANLVSGQINCKVVVKDG